MINKRKQTRSQLIFALLIGIGLFVFSFALLSFTIAPTQTHAAVPWDFSEPILQCGIEGKPTCVPCDIFKTIKNVVEIILTIAGSVAILIIIIAGTIYIVAPMSGADAKKRIQRAKQTMTYSIVGFSIIGLSWLILNTVTVLLGFSSDWFTIDCAKVNALIEEPAPISTPARSYYCGPGDLCVAAPASVEAGTTVYPTSNCDGKCAGVVESICDDPKALADKYHMNYELATLASKNGKDLNSGSDELKELMTCIRGQIPNIDDYISAVGDGTSPLCNFTRGHAECEADNDCGHAEDSCHFGGHDDGTTATQNGSLAIDLAIRPNNKTLAKQIVDIASRCPQVNQAFLENQTYADGRPKPKSPVRARCEPPYSGLTQECESGFHHIHISTKSCTAN